MKICQVEGCDRAHSARGYCQSHYVNYRRHGVPVVMHTRGLDLLPALLSRVPDKPVVGCWVWGSTMRGRYGVMKWNGTDQAAHRLMFEATYGYSTTEVRHRCDNPPCVRPDHLEGGTRQDNVNDRVNRGRSARLPGRHNPNARYTTEEIEEVLRLLGDGHTGKEVAAMTGVDRTAVSRFKNGAR